MWPVLGRRTFLSKRVFGFVVGLSFCLEGKNMNGHSDCDENENDSECQMFGYENGTADKTGPKRGDGNDLHFQRDSLVKHKILDVRSKSWMIHQPVVQPF